MANLQSYRASHGEELADVPLMCARRAEAITEMAYEAVPPKPQNPKTPNIRNKIIFENIGFISKAKINFILKINMDKNTKDPLYSDKYATTDFVWGQTLGEGKFTYIYFAPRPDFIGCPSTNQATRLIKKKQRLKDWP